jgi:hypothetical protein
MVRARRDPNGWFSIVGEPTTDRIRALRGAGCLDRLSITKARLITVEIAKRLRGISSVSWLWLWCDVTRGALSHIVQLPGLTTLDVLAICSPGTLDCFGTATELRTLRANHYLTEKDLLAVSKCPTLRELGIQNADLTEAALEALLSLPSLEALDLEGTPFDDRMAEQLRTSKIMSLDVGATRITRRGLKHLAEMKQLRSLDLWANQLTVDDLQLLTTLPNLEYLSVGSVEGNESLAASELVPLVLRLPAMKRLWLDGVHITTDQAESLKERLDAVRLT